MAGDRLSLAATHPIIYRVPAVLLGVTVTCLVLALRGRARSTRTALLVTQGVPPRAATAAAHVADLWVLGVAGLVGVALGAVLGVAAGPVLRWVAGHELSAMPLPLDPMGRVALPGLGLGLVVALCQIRAAGRAPRAEGVEARSTTARHLAAIVLTGASGLLVAMPVDFVAVVGAVLTATIALGLLAPTSSRG
ncbi:MAG: hypothetical protein ACTMIR_08275 [Cellulomonadaceae bacterium]